jgi:hypothetical protein
MGDESTLRTVVRFDSKDGQDETLHPVLTIEYHLPGE